MMRNKNPFASDELPSKPPNPFAEEVNAIKSPVATPSIKKNPFASEETTKKNPLTTSSEEKKNPFATEEKRKNPFYEDDTSPRLSSTLKKSNEGIFKFTPIEYRDANLKRLVIGDDLSVVLSEASSGEWVLSRRDLASFNKPDGQLVLKEAFDNIFCEPTLRYCLIIVKSSRNYQNDSTLYVNLQDASLKLKGPLPSLVNLTISAVLWLPTNGTQDQFALLGCHNGNVQLARFTFSGLSELRPVFAMGNDPILGMAISNQKDENEKVIMVVDGFGRLGWYVFDSSAMSFTKPPIPAGIDGKILEAIPKDVFVSCTGDHYHEFWLLTRRHLFRIFNYNVTVVKEENDTFIDMVQTEFSLVLASRHLVSSKTAMSVRLTCLSKINFQSQEKHNVLVQGASLLGLARDEVRKTIWAYSERGLAKVEVTEDAAQLANAWKLYLNRGLQTQNELDFDLALRYCHSKKETDAVIAAKAEFALKQQRYLESAELFAQVSNQVKSFEEIALMFTSLAQQTTGFEATTRKKALRMFLLGRLSRLREDKKTLRTMLGVWICEAFLDEMDQGKKQQPVVGRHERENRNEEEQKHAEEQDVAAPRDSTLEEEFCGFLGTYVMVLEPCKETVFHLISSHGRSDMLLVYAHLTKDYEKVIQYHLQRNKPADAVISLKSFAEKNSPEITELFYKYSPLLIASCPDMLIEALIQQGDGLDPVKLIPAMSRFNEAERIETPVCRYLEYVVESLGCRDAAVHNLLLTVYSGHAAQLDLFVRRETSQPGGYCFDSGYALRLCSDISHEARISLLNAMGHCELALRAALDGNLRDVAIRIASDQCAKDVQGNELGKRLWLKILEHALQPSAGDGKSNTPNKRALFILKQSDGVLSVEDLLSLPSVETIDDLKDEICQALEKYNTEIEKLKQEMEEQAESAESLRRDAAEERRRFDVIRASKKCDVCHQRMITNSNIDHEFYVFPCTHTFHADCLQKLVKSRFELATADYAQSCPFCGQAAVTLVAEPLIFLQDEQEARSFDFKI